MPCRVIHVPGAQVDTKGPPAVSLSTLRLTMHNVSEERQAGPARGRTDLGRRVGLVSMDPRFERISIGLYVDSGADGPVARLHTYSTKPGAGERLETVAHVIARLGGEGQGDEGPPQATF